MISTQNTVPYKVRLLKTDIEELRKLARLEALRLGRDLGWPDLVRSAIREMVTTRRPVGL